MHCGFYPRFFCNARHFILSRSQVLLLDLSIFSQIIPNNRRYSPEATNIDELDAVDPDGKRI